MAHLTEKIKQRQKGKGLKTLARPAGVLCPVA